MPGPSPFACVSDADCDDGIWCNGLERCGDQGLDDGTLTTGCVEGERPACDDDVSCTVDSCSEFDRSCAHFSRDVDGDGHTEACVGETGYRHGYDCDDDDPAVHRGASDVCDDIDNDCDGVFEENAMVSAWYPDDDGDGLGDRGAEPVTTCRMLNGYAREPNDCDDSDPMVTFAIPETCDALDNDCDGYVDEGAGCPN